MYEVTDLLGCESDTLLKALTQRSVETLREMVKTDLSSTEVSTLNGPSFVLMLDQCCRQWTNNNIMFDRRSD